MLIVHHAVSCSTGGAPVCSGIAAEVQLGRDRGETANCQLHHRRREVVGRLRKLLLTYEQLHTRESHPKEKSKREKHQWRCV